MTSVAGLVVVDKPRQLTSHDVVSRIRRIAGTRKVGHAGTLDPMATGVLLVGVNRATRLLGHLSLSDKTYAATVRLGVATVTDDADGAVIATHPVGGLGAQEVAAALSGFVGDIEQVPSAVSAVKVAGRRAYQRVRAGEDVHLPPRQVTVHELVAREVRREQTSDGCEVLDADVFVRCSTGTYVRAIARDLGERLGVGGHLTALRRLSVGPFEIGEAASLESLAHQFAMLDLDTVARRCFPTVALTSTAATAVRHGRPLAIGLDTVSALLDPDGRFLALYRPVASPAGPPLEARAVWVYADR